MFSNYTPPATVIPRIPTRLTPTRKVPTAALLLGQVNHWSKCHHTHRLLLQQQSRGSPASSPASSKRALGLRHSGTALSQGAGSSPKDAPGDRKAAKTAKSMVRDKRTTTCRL
eukprot:m.387778 g.387778  ORF g.387778 m.387778 type:complete len:113 (-) comp20066_c13_seq7:355-693(-)